MIFSSPIFLFLFLPVVLTIYWLISTRYKPIFLLLMSLAYYTWGGGPYIAILVLSALLNYFFGLLIGYFCKPFSCIVMEFHARTILWASILVNLSILFFPNHLLKFLINTLPPLGIPLNPDQSPLGVSFFTFAAMAYVFDIYLQKNKAQRNPLTFTLFISLFPKLIAGPIVRYADIERDLTNPSVRFEDIQYGIKRFIMGLGKKVLLADTLSRTVQQVMQIPNEQVTVELAWLGILSYTLQIYLDFSGYSDMAIGLGRMLGFHFFENFNYPYISRSITEFWRRWHISLSSWLKDYLYIPLGGSRVSTARTYLNLFVVFVLCGLWHGRKENFLIWGAFHGLILILERWKLSKILIKMPVFIQHGYAMLVIVFSWVFFSTESMRIAVRYFKNLFGFAKGTGIQYNIFLYINTEVVLALIIGGLCATPVLSRVKQYAHELSINTENAFTKRLSVAFAVSETSSLIIIFVLSLISMASITHNPFIYFKF